MLYNTLLEPQLVSDYHREYLHLINKYKNYKRPSVFIKYYNINYDISVSDNDTHSVFDIYKKSNVLFDIYDLTPSYVLNPINNATSNVQDMGGQMFESSANCVIFTIQRPRINDIIMFYDPVGSKEIYRVSNFRIPINTLYSGDDSLFFYELDLEIAPFKDINMLKIAKNFVYDLTEETYIEKEQYIKNINKLTRYSEILNELIKFYDPIRDVYRYSTLIPLITNQVIYKFKQKYCSDGKRLFENVYTPYGLLDFVPDMEDKDKTKIFYNEFNLNEYTVFDFDKYELIKYEFHNNHYDVDKKIIDMNYLLFLTKQLYDEINS
ncbi:MAG: hypothetical protein ACOC33_00695 [bacterium]